MEQPRLHHFARQDVLHLVIAAGPEAASVELAPNVTAELNAKGELIGVEVLNASAYLRDLPLESVQAKRLPLAPAAVR